MTKYLLLALLIVWLIYTKPWNRSTPKKTSAPKSPSLPEAMVVCAHCGVHLPASETISAASPSGQALHYCSEAHRRAGPRAN